MREAKTTPTGPYGVAEWPDLGGVVLATHYCPWGWFAMGSGDGSPSPIRLDGGGHP
jgi:hypothetical protein